ncbi:hypothetical protein KC207_08480 [Phycicoccus sp. BSK3Z-2]|uniref:Uncharacterized protein n=1 Tax=Phycicoccus avicenniae TaxID=2828860 RepID=A0A941D7Q7_9MICO|nr:hypothetical protein [Phycicoccus avicenniae]MBR7743323.1 hypothetical protein [Phycicoccus avicenniae]
MAAVNLGWLLWAAIDEAAVPNPSALPALPAGATVLERSVDCGSGGCWRELVLDTGDRPATDLTSELDLDEPRCRPSLPVPRRVCTDATAGPRDRLVVHARFAW